MDPKLEDIEKKIGKVPQIFKDLKKYTPEETYGGGHSEYISDLADKISTPFETKRVRENSKG